jgi:hypothetical protein
MRATPNTFADWSRRLLAAGLASLVLALTVFAASPAAHDWLHLDDDAPAKSEDGCAVVLFANGVSLPLDPITAPVPQDAVWSVSLVSSAEVFLVSPRYLRQPERGPPVSWVG